MTLLSAAPVVVVVVVARAIGSKSRRTSEWPRKEEENDLAKEAEEGKNGRIEE